MFTFRPNPLQYFLVPDIEVEENGDEEEEDLEEEEEEVDENVNLNLVFFKPYHFWMDSLVLLQCRLIFFSQGFSEENINKYH